MTQVTLLFWTSEGDFKDPGRHGEKVRRDKMMGGSSQAFWKFLMATSL